MRRKNTVKPVVMDARLFELTARRLANSLVFGMEDSIFHGCGIEYAQPRPYVPGDPIRLMDWKVTGRTGKNYLKEFQEPKRMPVYVLLDTSASMCVSSGQHSKYAWGLSLATGLALAAQINMSPAGLMGVGQRDIHVKPTLSSGTVMECGHRLRTHGFLEKTSVAEKIRQLASTLTTRTMLIVISDLHDEGAVAALTSAGQEHEVIVLHLQDPTERGLPGTGFYRGQEAETGRSFVGTGKQSWDISEDAKHELTRHRVDYVLLRTDQDVLAKVQFMFRMRGRGDGSGR